MKENFIKELVPIFQKGTKEVFPIIRQLIPHCVKKEFQHIGGHKDFLKISRETWNLDIECLFTSILQNTSLTLQEELDSNIRNICERCFPYLSKAGLYYSYDDFSIGENYNRLFFYFFKEILPQEIKINGDLWDKNIFGKIIEWIGQLYDFFDNKKIAIITKGYLTNVRIDKDIFIEIGDIFIEILPVKGSEFSDIKNEIQKELGRLAKGNMSPDCAISIKENVDIIFPPVSTGERKINTHKPLIEEILMALNIYLNGITNIVHYSQRIIGGIGYQPERINMPHPEVYKGYHWGLWIKEEAADGFPDFYKRFQASYELLQIPIHRLTDAKKRIYHEDAIIDTMIGIEGLLLNKGDPIEETLRKRFGKGIQKTLCSSISADYESIICEYYDIRSKIVHGNKKILELNTEELKVISNNLQYYLQEILKYIIQNELANKLIKNKSLWESL